VALTHLLDTSVYSQPLRRRWVRPAVERWRAAGDSSLCVSAICEAEVLQGLEHAGSERLWGIYEQHVRGRLVILPFDRAAAEVYAKLYAGERRAGRERPDFDLLIAATAMAHRLVLATLNVRHFAGIEGLAVEDWSR
jgi:predicted nucleic acid-binding protein